MNEYFLSLVFAAQILGEFGEKKNHQIYFYSLTPNTLKHIENSEASSDYAYTFRSIGKTWKTLVDVSTRLLFVCLFVLLTYYAIYNLGGVFWFFHLFVCFAPFLEVYYGSKNI